VNCTTRPGGLSLVAAALTATLIAGLTVEARTSVAAQTSKPAPPPKAAPAAKAPAKPAARVDQFSATTTNLDPGAGEMVTIDVTRWSTDEEVQQLVSAVTDKGDKLLTALQAAPTVGYLWVATESVGYPIRYAAHTPAAGGGERILFATNRPLGPDVAHWKAAGRDTSDGYGFALIELRLARGTAGEGKATLAAKIAVDPDKKAIGLENYAAAPVVFKDVKRVSGAPAAPRPAPAPAHPAPARKAPAAK
jgi:hypothetical protein